MSNLDEPSILLSVEKMLGIIDVESGFENDIIININSAFDQLYQMGVLKIAYSISGPSDKWNDILEITNGNMHYSIRQFIFLKTKIIFDPPESGPTINAVNSQIKELETRLYTESGGF